MAAARRPRGAVTGHVLWRNRDLPLARTARLCPPPPCHGDRPWWLPSGQDGLRCGRRKLQSWRSGRGLPCWGVIALYCRPARSAVVRGCPLLCTVGPAWPCPPPCCGGTGRGVRWAGVKAGRRAPPLHVVEDGGRRAGVAATSPCRERAGRGMCRAGSYRKGRAALFRGAGRPLLRHVCGLWPPALRRHPLYVGRSRATPCHGKTWPAAGPARPCPASPVRGRTGGQARRATLPCRHCSGGWADAALLSPAAKGPAGVARAGRVSRRGNRFRESGRQVSCRSRN